ncbi:MAG TPA: alkaline phosphatase family protein [Acidimicrobiales bacterium]|nr:alkaline phosphatase family protein [Acidimicrobiales bacterium]
MNVRRHGAAGPRISRRQLLASLGFTGAAVALAGPGRLFSRSAAARLAGAAATTRPAGSDLGAVEHIVFLMMENRSYDHYFGAYPWGRGFDDHPADSLGVFAQGYPGATTLSPPDVLLPFHLSSTGGEECTDDLTHAWGPQHLCWNNGKMDSYVSVHTSSTYEGSDGAMTMGYYLREDLELQWALADAFTLCDAYHCSILGPTHPNRLMANSGTIDPAGTHGGPVTSTNATPDVLWNCTWSTMQEVLQDAGVSWKVYHPSNADLAPRYAALLAYPTWDAALYNPTLNPEVMAASDHVLPYFTAFRDPASPLYQKAFLPTFPNDFVADVGSGGLPSVSWIIPPLGFDEHPSSSPANGMYFVSLVLGALTAREEVWSKTALILMYDENDGWFDHVPPPTAPPGTQGEYLTATPSSTLEPDADTLGITGPLGLGVRVPCLVISPFSRGGNVASEVFDHTSQLKLVAARFGVEVPNVSAWRMKTVGDLTSALFSGRYDSSVPALPAANLPAQTLSGDCSVFDQDTETGGAAPDEPTDQSMPNQQGGTQPATDFAPWAATTTSTTKPVVPTVPTIPAPSTSVTLPTLPPLPTLATSHTRGASGHPSRRPMTRKSAYNGLAQGALGVERVGHD